MAAQFSHRLFPDLSVVSDCIQRHSGESDASGLRGGAVAADAIGVQHGPNGADVGAGVLPLRRGLRLRKGLRGDNGEYKRDQDESLHWGCGEC